MNWLDANSTLPPDTERLLRLMKLAEETGEVAQAVISALGQNPCKARPGERVPAGVPQRALRLHLPKED